MKRRPLHGGPCLAQLDLLPSLAYKMAAMGTLMGEGLSSQISPGSRGTSSSSGPLYIPVQQQQQEKPQSSDTDTLNNSAEVKDVYGRVENRKKESQQRVSKCCNAGE
ncbi:hypothetical protein KOW79_019530 [Hemibagrus wyckioides]|uniref:Uncharacterized protein n=1 Tax=Hemibagrus wyckioides TaxID=337641 RepID=A0A9D3N7U0_9TELE|nr:hypothetical protein KOW79_019530 [Hemibagrus wyckioides]